MYWLFRDHSLTEFIDQLLQVDYGWIMVAFCLILLGYFIRAWRWRMLLEPVGYKGPVIRLFYNVMALYLVNLVLPRAGEVYRCGLLYRTDNIPVSASLGTVVTERIIDMVMLLLVTLLAFLLEFDKLVEYTAGVMNKDSASPDGSSLIVYLFAGAAGLFALGLLLYFFFRRKLLQYTLFVKTEAFIKDLIQGILSIRSLKSPFLFILASVGLWTVYFFLTYMVMLSIPSTHDLAILAVLSVLAMGGIGMAAPVQGGIGTYHALVAGVLVLYGITQQNGEFFAAISHSLQLVATVILGGIGMFLSLATAKKKQYATVSDKDRI